ncbi:MAG: tetratricopeptide repeat protein [Bacteroidales bacterium]
MAKQRRLSSKRASTKPTRRTTTRVMLPRVAQVGRSAAHGGNGHPDLHLDAVGAYQEGVEALQQRDFRRAQRLFEAVLQRFPEEKELHERVQVYLNVCHRQAAPPDATPRTTEERVYAATVAINAGAYERGLLELQRALQADSANDHVHYMLGVVYALRQDFASSLAHLQRAVELNAENRFLALQDADLVGLREADPSFRTIIDAAFTARRDQREGYRPRAASR